MIRRHIQRLANRFGYEVIRTPPLGYNLETHLKQLLPLLEVNVAIDVGANDGRTGLLLRRGGYNGPIFSFEPGPAYEKLARQAEGDPSWRTYPWGASDSEGSGELIVTNATELSSLYPLSELALDAFPDETAVVERRVVQMHRLDSVFSEFASGVVVPRVFLKTDTQGHDLAVIEGAAGFLNAVVALQVEAPLRPLYDGMPDCATLIGRLDDLGFRFFRAFNSNHHELEDYDQDWIFLRK